MQLDCGPPISIKYRIGSGARQQMTCVPRALRGPLYVLSSLTLGAGDRLVMRWFHISVIALFIAATLLFAVKNFEMVTMSFLGFSARAPLALLVAVVYLVGMATGGSLLAVCAAPCRDQDERRGHSGPRLAVTGAAAGAAIARWWESRSPASIRRT